MAVEASVPERGAILGVELRLNPLPARSCAAGSVCHGG